MVKWQGLEGEPCPGCGARFIDNEPYEEKLAVYLSSIPDEIKTEAEEYQKRINACRSCGEYNPVLRVCFACGCYVEMRAAKKVMYCPMSYGGW